jgi:hypothetical protein
LKRENNEKKKKKVGDFKFFLQQLGDGQAQTFGASHNQNALSHVILSGNRSSPSGNNISLV